MDDNYQESLTELLQHIIREKILRKQDLLRLFAFYIASNPDFKYNITYLTDSILPFFLSQKELVNRFTTFEAVTEKKAKLAPKELRAKKVLDDFFQFSIADKVVQDSEFVEINQYRFHKIDTSNYGVKFMIENDIEQSKIETYRFSFNLVKEVLKRGELQGEIKKNWRQFIVSNRPGTSCWEGFGLLALGKKNSNDKRSIF